MPGSRYHFEVPPMSELHRRELELRLEMLREFACKNERWFSTIAEVVDYLNAIGCRRHRTGGKITYKMLLRWRKKMGFPWGRFHDGRAPIVTSNIMIMAWLWSLRVYKATKPYKPNTRDLQDATAHLV